MTKSVLDRVNEIRIEDDQLTVDALSEYRKDYWQIAVREYRGISKAEDADSLLRAMQALDLNDADFANATAAIGRVAQVTAQLQHATTVAEGSHNRQQEAQREWRRVNALARQVQRMVNIEKRRAGELCSARESYGAVEAKFPELFTEEALAALASQIKLEVKQIAESKKRAADNIAAQELSQLNRLLAQEGLKPFESLSAAK